MRIPDKLVDGEDPVLDAQRFRRSENGVCLITRDMIEQLLFTSPGERVNRPDFGCGLLKLVFAPNSPELAQTLQGVVQASIQRWLGDLIELRHLEVTAEDSTLTLVLSYLVRRTNEVNSAEISRTV